MQIGRRRQNGEEMRAAEPKCPRCCSMSWRVKGAACIACGLEYAEEEVERGEVSIPSSGGFYSDHPEAGIGLTRDYKWERSKTSFNPHVRMRKKGLPPTPTDASLSSSDAAETGKE